MTAQDKINELALAALRAAPPSRGVPKPTTFMAPFEKPKTAPIAEKPAAPSTPAPVEKVEAPVQEAAPAPFKDEADPELRAMIKVRDARIKKSRSRQSLLVSVAALAVLAAVGTWFAASPKGQGQAKSLGVALKQSAKDVKMIGSITSQYDESLKEIAGHGTEISEATRALGVDPASLKEGEDVHMDAEMKSMMGENGGPTTAERDRALKEKFGVVGKLVGSKQAPASAPTAVPQS